LCACPEHPTASPRLSPAPAPPGGLQTPYRAGTPHTDRQGQVRLDYQPERSFLPLGLYHALAGRFFGRDYPLDQLAQAGFNTIHLWEGQPPGPAVAAAGRAGLQVIVHQPDDDTISALASRPELLAWYLDEEPSLHLTPDQQPAALAAFRSRYRQLHTLDPRHPVLVLDYPAFQGRQRETWLAWARAGEISAHDNYPLRLQPEETLDQPNGIPASVALALQATRQAKPLWLVVQAMASPGHRWRMPEPEELRAMVYAGLIHGATGIVYFAFDSFATRDGQVLGIAPDPLPDYGADQRYSDEPRPALVVGEPALAGSRRLWAAAANLNRELAQLAPALLSPTSALDCTIEVSGPQVSPTPIRALLKQSPAGPVMLAVNLDRQPLSATFHCPGLPGPPQRRFAPNAAAPPPVAPQGWRDDFGPLAVQVYHWPR